MMQSIASNHLSANMLIYTFLLQQNVLTIMGNKPNASYPRLIIPLFSLLRALAEEVQHNGSLPFFHVQNEAVFRKSPMNDLDSPTDSIDEEMSFNHRQNSHL